MDLLDIHLHDHPSLLLHFVLQDKENKNSVNDVANMVIDKANSGNQLAATESVEELYNFYRQTEVIF
jgi:hypothetical protein